jgi:superfamily II RNA helicase
MSDILNTAPLAVDPTAHRLSPEEAFDHFLQFVLSTGAALYPAQEEAILEIMQGNSVILNTPTGSGKSLVATAHHFFALSQGRTSIYTAPIKALVSEKFFALCKLFGPQQVGMMTGDASINPSAPILCCTAEVLSQMALRFGDEARVHDVIMDEFHYYSDRDRGVAWQVPLLTLPRTRFLLMSATLGETAFFEQELTRLNGRPTVTVRSGTRPVPLDWQGGS